MGQKADQRIVWLRLHLGDLQARNQTEIRLLCTASIIRRKPHRTSRGHRGAKSRDARC
ncbi:hypothetical protein D3C73_633690 [compost metagenome]